MKLTLSILLFLFITTTAVAQPVKFSCTSSDGFGYYIASATSSLSGSTLTYGNSRLSKITTATGIRTTLCDYATVGVIVSTQVLEP